MKKKSYNNLCKICDDILLDESASNSTVAISGLHVIKAHPEYLKKYLYSYLQDFLNLFSFTLKGVFNYCLYFVKNSFYKKTYFPNSKIKGIIISHLLTPDQIKNEKDLYFGNLQKILQKKKIYIQKILINHTKTSSNKLNKNLKNKSIFVMPKYLKFFSEVKIFFCQINELLRIGKKISITKNNKKNFLLKKICLSIFNPETTLALRMKFLLKRYIKEQDPNFIICTHEGYAWERMVFNTSKETKPSIRCIGYQHALFTKSQHAIKRKLKGKYNPDIIWTSGTVSEKELNRQKKLNGIKIKNIGSLKFNNDHVFKKINFNKKTTCLVIPEGIISECIKLFEFSLNCAKIMPNVNFIWRVHPSLNFNYVIKKMNINFELPKNISFSKNAKLKNDMRLSEFALYRGSAAIASALSFGIYPIYLGEKDEIEIDPLYELKFKNLKIYTPKQFQMLLYRLSNKSKSDHKKFQKKAFIFSKKFYSRFSEKVAISSLR